MFSTPIRGAALVFSIGWRASDEYEIAVPQNDMLLHRLSESEVQYAKIINKQVVCLILIYKNNFKIYEEEKNEN